MYSFEGEYRRTPQQKLCGASSVLDRDQLLTHARQQRLEREQQRKRCRCSVLIQAYVRSFVVRCRAKREQRILFDGLLKDCAKKAVSVETLESATRKLLFFYWDGEDKQKLVRFCIQ